MGHIQTLVRKIMHATKTPTFVPLPRGNQVKTRSWQKRRYSPGRFEEHSQAQALKAASNNWFRGENENLRMAGEALEVSSIERNPPFFRNEARRRKGRL
jgi:hypothetical protein